MDKLQKLCDKFLDKRYYFEYSTCGKSSTNIKVFDIFLQYKTGTKYPFGVLQMNCERDLIESFALGKSESYDLVRDWVEAHVNNIKKTIKKSNPKNEVLSSLLDTCKMNPHEVSDEEWNRYLKMRKSELIDNYKRLGIFAYYNYKAVNGFVD